MDLYTVQEDGALAVLSAPPAIRAVALPLAVGARRLRKFALAVLTSASLDTFLPCLPRSTVQALPAAILAFCHRIQEHFATGLALEAAAPLLLLLLAEFFLAGTTKDSIERHV